MKKNYQQPQTKFCNVNTESLLDDDLIQVSVHTDDPQPPGGALAGENTIWEDEQVATPRDKSVWQ